MVDRLSLYGVRPGHIALTGYPLPAENLGNPDLGILKQDLAQRMANLDPDGRYLQRYGSVVRDRVGSLPGKSDHPLTLLFSIGGAGAQTQIAASVLRSLRERIATGEVRLVLSAGIKGWVRDSLLEQIRGVRLAPFLGTAVDIVFAEDITEYFRQANLAARKADILWTKPSELSFYTALGLPIIIAPPLGSQEEANQEWLIRLGSGIPQDDPRYANEWLFDLLKSGWFAEAAMQGFVEAEELGTFNIRKVIQAD